MWMLWLMSVVIGALAVAVSLFVVTHNQYALYEATHENFFTFMVDTLPYIWMLVFALTAYVAIINLRHTKRGYNYSLTVIILGGVILSFAGGSALQLFGLGYTVDDILGQNMEMYMSQDKAEQKMWQMPKDGRLVGVQVLSTLAPTTTVVFEDVEGRLWNMEVDELRPRDIELLASGKTVRLMGECVDKDLNIFHACGVFPWMVEEGVTVEDMDRERRFFIEGVNKYADKQHRRLTLLEESRKASTTADIKESVCMKIMPIRRMAGVQN